MRTILAGICSLIAALLALPATAMPAGQPTYAITDVVVVPMDRERLVPGQTVIIRAGRIESIGPTAQAQIPVDAIRIAGRGRYLMPGLAEMHAHVPPDPADVQGTEEVLFLYVANGVTFARSMLGAPHHLSLRTRAEQGEIVSPRIYAAGPSFSGSSVTSPEAARHLVREQRAAGYDTLKVQTGLDRASYDAMAATARELGISFAGHIPQAVGLAHALESGLASVEHLDGYMNLLLPEGADAANPGSFGFRLSDRIDEARIVEVARRTRAASVWNVPTDSLIHHVYLPEPSAAEMDALPELGYVSPATREQWRRARATFQSAPGYDPALARRFGQVRARLIRALQDEGAGLLLGSDAPQRYNVPGFSVHRELRYLVDAGLTPYQALATGTRNVAQFIGNPDAFGTVAPGRRADLILIEADPLADVANVQRRAGVMLNGRWIPESEIQAGLARIADRHAAR